MPCATCAPHVGWQLPPFLVGRVQWDQWLLLWCFVHDIPTIEVCMHACTLCDIMILFLRKVSEVVNALHVNHGRAEASHSKHGTDVNKKLAEEHVPVRHHDVISHLSYHHVYISSVSSHLSLLSVSLVPARHELPRVNHFPRAAGRSCLCPAYASSGHCQRLHARARL